MSSASIATIVKMVESLPNELQEKVVEHMRDYITDLADEKHWDILFHRSHDNLVAAAHKAKREIAEGLSIAMDYEQL